MTSQNATGRTASLTFQSGPEDERAIARHMALRRIQMLYLYVGYSCILWPIARSTASIPLLHTVPVWIWWLFLVFGCLALYASSVRSAIRAAVRRQQGIRSLTVTAESLVVTSAGGAEPDTFPIGHVALRRRRNRLFIEGAVWVAVPEDAVAEPAPEPEQGSLAAADFEETFHHNLQMMRRGRPPARTIDGYSHCITFQQTKGDIVYAYYHGRLPIFLRSMDGKLGLGIAIGIAATAGLLMRPGAQGIVGFLAAISGIIILYMASPAFPISVIDQRRTLSQPLTLAVGAAGAAVDTGSVKVVIPWEKIAAITRRLAFVLRDDIILIPRSAFLDDASLIEFQAAAEAYRRGGSPAQSASTVWPPPPLP